MGSGAGTGYDYDGLQIILLARLKTEYFEATIKKYFGGRTMTQMLSGLKVALMMPRKLRTKCCIFEAMMLTGVDTFEYVVLKLADMQEDMQTQNEVGILKRLIGFGDGIPLLQHESTLVVDGKEYLRVAFTPFGRYSWAEDERPVKFATDSDLTTAGTHLLKIMERLYYNYDILHNDIKPSNIITVDYDVSPELIDFGTATHSRHDCVLGFTTAFASEMKIWNSSEYGILSKYPSNLWDDIESLLFTLFAMKVGEANYTRPTLLHVLNTTPSAQTIALPLLCTNDMFSIAITDPSFSFHNLNQEIAAATPLNK